MALGSVSSGGALYAEAAAALYESPKRPLVLSFMAGMGGEAIVLKEFYWMTEEKCWMRNGAVRLKSAPTAVGFEGITLCSADFEICINSIDMKQGFGPWEESIWRLLKCNGKYCQS